MRRPKHARPFAPKFLRLLAATLNKRRKGKEIRREDEETNVEIIQSESLLEETEGLVNDTPRSNIVGRLSEDRLSVLNDDDSDDDSRPLSYFASHLQHRLSEAEFRRDIGKKHSLNVLSFSSTVMQDDGSNCKWMATKGFNNISNTPSLKEKLNKHWKGVTKEFGGYDTNSNEQHLFFQHCRTYRDILYDSKTPFYLEGGEEDINIMGAYIMHALNHIFRTRECMEKNDAKIAKIGVVADYGSFQDQGFTRPKVLILLPLASIMYRVVKNLIELTPPANKNVENWESFSATYGGKEQKGNKEKGKEPENAEPKPKDFELLFGGNNDENFIIGIEFTGTTIKLLSDLHSSDFIIASPRCLVNKIEEAKGNKQKNVDFLSSIEILIIDHADVIAMQDWSHADTIMQHLNRLPSKLPKTDMRIRSWYLKEEARFYRQTMILGYYSTLDIFGSFYHCSNYEGKMRRQWNEHEGHQWFSKLEKMMRWKKQKAGDCGLPHWLCTTLQVFERFTEKPRKDDDARYNYFVQKIFPRIKDSAQGGIVIFTSSHSESIQILEFLQSKEVSVYLVGEEHADQMDISSARLQFSERKIKIMLYTEKSHFYHRYKIHGVKFLIMYSLPERKDFYFEILGMLSKSENRSCTVLYSRFDKDKLLRIVGTKVANILLDCENPIFPIIK